MLYLQLYPWNINLIKNVEENVVFRNPKLKLYRFVVSYKQVIFAENPQMKQLK